MTTYYVSKNGSDSNNGLGPDASHASNKPWLTVGKALGAAGIASGDTVYIAPGIYRQAVTVAMTSATVETLVRGDPANAQGFKNSSGVLVPAGEVRLTSYSTNDTTDPGASAGITLAGRDYLTLEDLLIVGRSTGVDASTATSTHITFRRCHIVSLFINGVVMANAALVVFDWLLEKCVVRCGGNAFCVQVTGATSATGADYDLNVVIRDCLLFAPGNGNAVEMAVSGANAFEPNGVHVRNSTLIGGTGFNSQLAALSNTIANTVYNCLIIGGTGLRASATGGLITEDYNRIIASVARSNVSTGAHSVADASHCNLFELGQSALWGMRARPPFTPWAGDPLLGFGNTSGSSDDLLGVPRPSGGTSALPGIGAYERPNTWGRETTTVRTGSNALVITGPGVQDFELPVDAASTTVSAYLRWDSTYAGTKPQLKVLVGSECGVSDATATATGSANSWEQLSLNFTPARAGIVTVRLQSNDSNGGGKTYADDFAVAA